ncbi:LysR family transcriptional regulator [Actinomadura decatromicini]|uniref:LysR family transcriptional regulator n=1 Tax=Actinomadura decatromicini TaxID=2604572 RepID=A0A5D3FJZ6_9ACTN|nr:LysR substrate-binding domain-containing protein [Actinomadura decatromicini]TYK48374.1 LysR family transcriptional regulator [Actinomadura decatromicini]
MRAEALDPVLLRTFVAVADLGSFTAAAAAGGYTQSAVSRQIAALEDVCGVELFARGARGVRPTPAGEHLLPHARGLLDRLADTARALEGLRRLDTGTLRLGAFPTANAALVPRALARFRERHPGVRPLLREGTTERLLPMLEAGDLDLAVVSTHTLPSIPAGDLVELLDDALLVALPSGHRLAGRDHVPLRELADEPWIVADQPDAVAALRARCAAAGFVPETPLRVAEWVSKLGLVAAGFGVTLVPALAAAAMSRDDVALRPLASAAPARRAVYAAVGRHARRSPPVAAFLAVLREVAEDLGS